jgi:hypothetical protein
MQKKITTNKRKNTHEISSRKPKPNEEASNAGKQERNAWRTT